LSTSQFQLLRSVHLLLFLSAFVEDKKLYLRKSTCLVQPLHQLKGLLNLQSLDISFLEFKLAIENYLRNKVLDRFILRLHVC
jgi:hypothetical protein